MIAIPIAFGILSILAGLLMLARPSVLTRFLVANNDRLFVHVSAVLSRLVLGAALVITATVSQFPVILFWLGWLTIVAAVVLAFVGRARFGRLISWAEKIGLRFGRVGGGLAVLFGLFLIYAYL